MAAAALIPIAPESAVILAHSFDRAQSYADNSKAPNTRRGYSKRPCRRGHDSASKAVFVAK